jgi:hypothetical protein
VIDNIDIERLHHCVRRESRSLLQYVREVPLWAGAEDRHAFDRVRELAETERQAVDRLAGWLQKNHAGINHLGPFPSVFMDVNDAGFRHLLPRLIAEHRELLDRLEADAGALAHTAAAEHLYALLAQKRRHHADLQTMQAVENAA